MHLVEGVGFKDPLVSCPNEDLQSQGLVFHVAMELGGEDTKSNYYSASDVQSVAAVVWHMKRLENRNRKSTGLLLCPEEWRSGSNLDAQPEGTTSVNHRGLLYIGILSGLKKECGRSDFHL